MDLLCNTKVFGNIYKANKKMRIHSNGGNMLITHKVQIVGHQPHVWFDKKSYTNLIDLKSIINQYRVTYDSLDEMFIFHQEKRWKQNMHFIMNESGLNYYDQENENLCLSTQFQATRKVTAIDR